MHNQEGYGESLMKSLFRQPMALPALILIGLAIVAAIFAYPLSADPSTWANRQTVELQSQKPGFTIQCLVQPIPVTVTRNSWDAFWNGHPVQNRWIPVNSVKRKGDSIYVQPWVNELAEPEKSYHYRALGMQQAGDPVPVARKKFVLGTDPLGRDIYSRLLLGTRISLGVGLVAVLVSLLIGIVLGLAAGYYRGRIDAMISWLMAVTWSLPALLLVFALTLALGKGLMPIFIAVGLTMWVQVARVVRGQTLTLKEREYVQAAKVMGFHDARIVFRHIFPNMIGPLMVVSAANFAAAIMIEAGLSFLGAGVRPPVPSWGGMVREHYHYLLTDKAILALIPGLAIMLLVLAFQWLGNAIRDAMGASGRM